MKVLLINSTWSDYYSHDYNTTVYTPEISSSWIPLGLAYIAATLRENKHNVNIIDRNARFYIEKDIERVNQELLCEIKRLNPEVIGISATTPLISDAYKTAKFIKQHNKDIYIILGGVHGTVLPHRTLEECSYIDIIIRGEGEKIFINLLNNLNHLKSVKGISYRDKKTGKIEHNTDEKLIYNLDSIPYPARDLLDMKFYTRPSTQIIFGYKVKGTSMITSRGCPGRCNFCAGPSMSRNKVRFHSPEYSIMELKNLVDNYHVEGLFFVDEMFTTDKKRIIKLCELIKKNNFHKKLLWGVQLRADFVDKEILYIMKQAGCVQVEFGFESGSNKVLKDMNKRLTIDKSLEASKIAKQVGIRQLANIIVGWPTETLQDLKMTIEFVEKIDPEFVSWHEYRPLPGSSQWDAIDDDDKYDFKKNSPFRFSNANKEEIYKMKELYFSIKNNYASNDNEGLYMEAGGI